MVLRMSLSAILLALGLLVFCSPAVGQWPLTESNSWITDVPTVEDFVPLGTVLAETTGHVLMFDREDPQWRLK